MSQKLAILIQNNERNVACATYLMAAHTSEALRLTALGVNSYNHRLYCNPVGFDAYHQAIDILVSTGAGLCQAAKKNPEFSKYPECINETKGIIYISSKSINEQLAKCDKRVTIDIGTEHMIFEVYEELSREDFSKPYWQKEKENVDETIYADIFDIMCIPIICFPTLRKFINLHPTGVIIDDGIKSPHIYKWI